MTVKKILITLILCFPLFIIGQASDNLIKSYFVKVNPKGTYLRTNNDVTYVYDDEGNIERTLYPRSPSSFSLARATDINPGDMLYLMAEGDFSFILSHSTTQSMLGVFVDSNGDYLMYGPNSEPNIGSVSLRTHNGNLKTDITEDFFIPFQNNACVRVEVPENASRILFSPNDSFSLIILIETMIMPLI